MVNAVETVPHWSTARETLTIERGTNGGRCSCVLRLYCLPWFESWSRQGHFIIRSISLEKHVFFDGLCQHMRRFLERTKDLSRGSRWLGVYGSSFYIKEAITGFLRQQLCRGNSKDMLRMEWKLSASIHRNYNSTPNQSNKHRSVGAE